MPARGPHDSGRDSSNPAGKLRTAARGIYVPLITKNNLEISNTNSPHLEATLTKSSVLSLYSAKSIVDFGSSTYWAQPQCFRKITDDSRSESRFLTFCGLERRYWLDA